MIQHRDEDFAELLGSSPRHSLTLGNEKEISNVAGKFPPLVAANF
jgi:hypothetical protein